LLDQPVSLRSSEHDVVVLGKVAAPEAPKAGAKERENTLELPDDGNGAGNQQIEREPDLAKP
jgi:hypothetical protein